MDHLEGNNSNAQYMFKLTTDPLTFLDQHTIRLLRREPYENAQMLPTTLGGGPFGHLGIIMLEAEFATLTPTPYVLPIISPLQCTMVQR
jgi:hypothetical protein